jgi:hypothetical protein
MNKLLTGLCLFLLALPACGPKRPEIPSEPEAVAHCSVPENVGTPFPEAAGRTGPEGTILLHMVQHDLTRDRVPFRHSPHKGLACENCHRTRGGNLVLRIDFAQTCPHGLCEGCHAAMAERGEPTGPVTCSGCHTGRVRQ